MKRNFRYPRGYCWTCSCSNLLSFRFFLQQSAFCTVSMLDLWWRHHSSCILSLSIIFGGLWIFCSWYFWEVMFALCCCCCYWFAPRAITCYNLQASSHLWLIFLDPPPVFTDADPDALTAIDSSDPRSTSLSPPSLFLSLHTYRRDDITKCLLSKVTFTIWSFLVKCG